MEIFNIFWNEIINFLGLTDFFKILIEGNYSSFLTYKGIVSLIRPIIPLLLILEFTVGFIYKKPNIKVYQTVFLIYIFNRFLGRFISIAAVTLCIGFFEKYAFLQTKMTWYWFLYSYIIWEFGHFIYHFLGHKVRFFWCFHATHHTPEEMNLSVSHAHFFLEAPYADLIRTTICIVLGVEPAMLFTIMFIDGTYGSFIHIGDNMIKSGKLGILNKIILTPSHHRIHHARNPQYIDTNYCNLLNIWDRLFGTYKEEDPGVEIDYGITRKINSSNFIDVYFGEFILLFKDVIKAPGLKNKLYYIFCPPGWNHKGNHKTARHIKLSFLKKDIYTETKKALNKY